MDIGPEIHGTWDGIRVEEDLAGAIHCRQPVEDTTCHLLGVGSYVGDENLVSGSIGPLGHTLDL